MDWSFQIYSARKFGPLEHVLETVASAGYRQIEGVASLYQDPPGLRALLDRFDLTMPTGHFSLDMLDRSPEQAFAVAESLGIGTMICPHVAPPLRPEDRAGWERFAGLLGDIGAACKSRGFEFAWHNHDFEIAPTQDGTTPQEIILETAPDIGWEIDVAWIVRGGGDPRKWIDAYGDRIVAVHVKDIAERGTAADEDGWADVGHGTMGWAELIPVLREKTRAHTYVMEHDNPSDFARFAARSLDYVSRL